jgi:hypothetical protein
MRKMDGWLAGLAGLVTTVGCNAHRLVMDCKPRVPTPYVRSDMGTPNGEPESVRYAHAYESFWWNCVVVRAQNLGGRCPFVCSGTPGASAGCSDGAADADRQVERLLKHHPKDQVVWYLRDLARDAEAQRRIRTCFPNGPREERVER